MIPWVAYSCVTDGYDRLVAGGAAGSLQARPEAQFLCFTDQPSSGAVPAPWQSRSIAAPSELGSGNEINRYHKLFPQRVLPACEFSIYHDGNIRYDADYGLLVERLRERGAAMGAFRHPAGRTLEEEVASCLAQGKLDKSQAIKAAQQLASYGEEGFDCRALISANYLLVRDHRHPDLPAAMDLWWQQLLNHTPRDQLSLGYILWKTGLPFTFLDEERVSPPVSKLDDSSSTFSAASPSGDSLAVPVRLPHSRERWNKRWQRLRSRVLGSET